MRFARLFIACALAIGCRPADAVPPVTRQSSASDTLTLHAESYARAWMERAPHARITNERYEILGGSSPLGILHVKDEETYNAGLETSLRCEARLEVIDFQAKSGAKPKWTNSVDGCAARVHGEFLITTEYPCCDTQVLYRYVDLASGGLRFVGNDSLFPVEIPGSDTSRYISVWANGSVTLPPGIERRSAFVGLLQYGTAAKAGQRIVIESDQVPDCSTVEVAFVSKGRKVSGLIAPSYQPEATYARQRGDPLSVSVSCYGLGDDSASAVITIPIRGDSLSVSEATSKPSSVRLKSNPGISLAPR